MRVGQCAEDAKLALELHKQELAKEKERQKQLSAAAEEEMRQPAKRDGKCSDWNVMPRAKRFRFAF